MGPQYTSYRIKQGDNLPSLAAMFLGDAARFGELALLNRLRAPYISDRGVDRYGAAQWEGVTQGDLAAGATGLVHPGIDPTLAVAGAICYLQTTGASGLDTADAATILAYAPPATYAGPVASPAPAGTPPGTLLLAGAIQHAYHAGAYLAILAQSTTQSYRVLAPGDLLYLPAVAAAVSVAAAGAVGKFVDLFGTDIRIAADGTLLTADGDLATVSGLDCLAQGLELEIESEPGDLEQHPAYGNAVLPLIGAATTPTLLTLIAAGAASTAAHDPRILLATPTAVTMPAPDTVRVLLELRAVGLAETVSLPISAPGIRL